MTRRDPRTAEAGKPTVYDAVVVGAGAAGATAAAILARHGFSVALIDRADPRVGPSTSVWVGGGVAKILRAAGARPERAVARDIRTVRFLSEDLQEEATVRLPAKTAGFADLRELRSCLIAAAKRAGATLLFGRRAIELRADEQRLRVRTDIGRETVARLGIVASGWGGGGELLPAAMRPTGRAFHRAHVELSDGAAGSPSRPATACINLVLGPQAGEVSYWWQRGKKLVLDVGSGGDANMAKATLVKLAKTLVDVGQATPRFVDAAHEAEATVSPAGKALEAHSHVIKRGLIAGEAGGFVGAAGSERLYPAMWSAQLAADVLREALSGDRTQDVLRRYESRWRTTLAPHLQPLDMDMRFLRPLLFSNPAIAEKTALSIFGGRPV